MFLDYFTPDLILNECIWTPHECPLVVMPVNGRENRRMCSQSRPRFVRGVGHGPWYLHFPRGFLFARHFSTTWQC